MDFDPYGTDVLAAARERRPAPPPQVPAEPGLVIEDAASGFCGAIVRMEGRQVELEDYFGAVRAFPIDSAFLIDGRRVELVPARVRSAGRARTASGSFAVEQQRARVARSSRILVEGRHDAELVEKVWGADLRVEGVVVEYLEGIDDLPRLIAERDPSRERRLGVLVDHLVPGSKEQRIADAVSASRYGDSVLVVGHPFIDIWQAVKPARLGMDAWPIIPKGTDWKRGVCTALGWPAQEQADIANAWQTILGRVRTFADLEPALLGRVEQLIDFVTEPGSS